MSARARSLSQTAAATPLTPILAESETVSGMWSASASAAANSVGSVTSCALR